MRQFLLPISLFTTLCVMCCSCHTAYQATAVKYKDYHITHYTSSGTSINALLKPYADSVNKSMNDVIAVAGMALEKRQPEGTLNNVLADAMFIMAKEKYQTAVDAAFINFGGIRLPALAAGNITRGKVFEMAPFDNMVVLLKIDGKTMKQFLNLVAGRGGWPCAGIAYQIKDKQAINILIGGRAFNDTSTYSIALLDYVANGGDDCEMLKVIPQQNNGYLFRNAVLEYFTRINKAGKQIAASIENRVTNAN
jgi:2',3'-cyclic-nucleotide 2'-phosphodiesterase (5'-nucleotidase family)